VITLAEFQATRTHYADLSQQIDDLSLVGVSGFCYVDSLFITDFDGEVFLTIGNCEWVKPAAQLVELEVLLYEFGCDEGYCNDATTSRDPTAVPACRLHIDHELDPKYHE